MGAEVLLYGYLSVALVAVFGCLTIVSILANVGRVRLSSGVLGALLAFSCATAFCGVAVVLVLATLS